MAYAKGVGALNPNLFNFSSLLALSGILFSSAKAIEVSDLHFKELNKQQGLSDTALDIVEDNNGYIWLATSNGLNRYSGYEVKHITLQMLTTIHSVRLYSKSILRFSWRVMGRNTSRSCQYQPESDNFKVFNRENSN